MSRLRLLLVRHGQSVANVARRMQGRLDTPLTAEGMHQAAAIAERIAAETRVDGLYTSPLQRALETARSIGNRIGVEPVLLHDLMEVDVGAATGLSRAEVKRCWPEQLQSLRRRDLAARWPDGESLRELAERAARVMEAIQSRHPAGVVVVVSHKGTLRCAMTHFMKRATEACPDHAFDHCAITEVVLSDEEPILACVNDRSHLAHLDEKVTGA